MDQFNFLRLVDGLKGQGDGFRRDVCVDLGDAYDVATGASLTTTLTTLPGYAVSEVNGRSVKWAAAIVTAAGFQVTLPGDYDRSKDEFRVYGIFGMGGATNTPGVTLNAYNKRPQIPAIGNFAAQAAVALSANLGPASGILPTAGHAPLVAAYTAAAALSATPKLLAFELSQKGLLPNDVLDFSFVPGAHGTDAVELFGVFIRFRSTLSLYNESWR